MGFSLDKNSVIELKKAGISDETILSMVKEKTIETAVFSIQEILELKNAGISDETIRLLITEGSFLENSEPITYGKDIRSIQYVTTEDIIMLKKAGVSNDTIRAVIIYGSKDISAGERDKAWYMLQNMGILFDRRKKK
jgi:hypothetical protein